MRHSRRRVMTERYRLYLKKNIFNGRYFERNLQIAVCMVLVMALMVGCVVVGVSVNSAKEDGVSVSVRDALFGNTDQNAKKSEKHENMQDVANDVLAVSKMTEAVTDVTAATDETNTDMVADEATTEEQKLFADRCIANVDETLNIRMEPDQESEFVGSMDAGAIAIVEGTEGEWTKIRSGDVEGYVLTQYILTGSVAESFAKDYVILHGTILEDGVNIRSEQSTDSDIIAVLDTDAVVTVLEDIKEDEEVVTPGTIRSSEENVELQAVKETEPSTDEDLQVESAKEEQADVSESEDDEELQWIHVRMEDGQEGYVSAELIDIDELYQVAVSAEELQRRAQEEAEAEAARLAAEAEASRKAVQAASGATSAKKTNTTYQGAVTTPITTATSGESLGTFTITAYCGCSKCSGGNNLTASGTVPTQGRTIAADTSVLPYGSQVVIGGVVYTVEDCGSGVNGNHIDIFFATHEQAMAFGRKSMEVFKY